MFVWVGAHLSFVGSKNHFVVRDYYFVVRNNNTHSKLTYRLFVYLPILSLIRFDRYQRNKDPASQQQQQQLQQQQQQKSPEPRVPGLTNFKHVQRGVMCIHQGTGCVH